MSELLDEVNRFRQWAAANPTRDGGWECDYVYWPGLYGAVTSFIDARPFARWSPAERDAVLYALARDNETQYLARELRERGLELLLSVAHAARDGGEPDAKWQLADELGNCPPLSPVIEECLLDFAGDDDEYVRRRALQSLARLGSANAERVALAEWERPHEHQQWARMNALWALHRLSAPSLPRLLDDAERDPREHLADFARRMRAGDVPA